MQVLGLLQGGGGLCQCLGQGGQRLVLQLPQLSAGDVQSGLILAQPLLQRLCLPEAGICPGSGVRQCLPQAVSALDLFLKPGRRLAQLAVQRIGLGPGRLQRLINTFHLRL